MSAVRQTEFRNIAQVRSLQALLDAKHEKLAAAKRVAGRDLRIVPVQPIPEPFAWVDAGVFLTPMTIVAALILLARWSGVLS